MMIFEVDGSQSDVLLKWADKLEESLHEAKLVDSYKMQVRHRRSMDSCVLEPEAKG